MLLRTKQEDVMSGGRDLCMKSLIALFAEDHAENECMVRLNEYNFYQPSGHIGTKEL